MSGREQLAARLTALGVELAPDDLDEVASTYATLARWRAIFEPLVDEHGQPAVALTVAEDPTP